MSFVAAAITSVATIGAAIYTSNAAKDAAETAADAAIQAAGVQTDYQEKALDYLKEREAIPQFLREGALLGLGGVYGIPGGVGSQQDLIDRATASPLYSNIMSGKEAGEESILRNASATGGLRSGDVNANMYDYNVQLQNNALLESYNQQLMGLQGLGGLPSNAGQIAGQISGIGRTQAQGITAGAQATQQGDQNAINNIMAMANLGISAYGNYKNS
ncbi:MAG TPA: hypothetical protein VMV86_02815 [Methanosarcinales archaeon]|nr:hypothetical protein [Methanosarcinales archaeon]